MLTRCMEFRLPQFHPILTCFQTLLTLLTLRTLASLTTFLTTSSIETIIVFLINLVIFCNFIEINSLCLFVCRCMQFVWFIIVLLTSFFWVGLLDLYQGLCVPILNLFVSQGQLLYLVIQCDLLFLISFTLQFVIGDFILV